MPNYQNGKIYAIRAPNTNEVYIGSTTKLLCQRIAGHRDDYKRWKVGTQTYMTSYKMLEYEGHYIELIEKYPCNSKEELNKREGEIMRTYPTAVNKYATIRTELEKTNYRLNYRQKNLEKYKSTSTEKLECECGAVISRAGISTHKKTQKHLNAMKSKLEKSSLTVE